MGNSMKLCIVEDNKPLLENLRLLIEGEPGFRVIGAFSSAEAALAALPWQDANLLLVDIDLPGLSGVDLIYRVHPQMPQLQIMVYTISENRDTVFAALKAGALGYLLKGCPPRELIESLRSLYQGGAPMSPRIARKVIRTQWNDIPDQMVKFVGEVNEAGYHFGPGPTLIRHVAMSGQSLVAELQIPLLPK